ncbi:MAG: hypothetical protein V4712_15795 [Pseudomonadota bacterium]
MPIDRVRGLPLVLGLTLAATVAAARTDRPLSAIDWLSQSVTAPAAAARPARSQEPAVADGGALPAAVSTTALDGPSPDAAGLITPAVSGLPHRLWGAGRTLEIASRLTAEQVDALPALRQLMLTLLLAEAEAPADSEGKGLLLLARVDKLLALGGLEQAAALIRESETMTPDLFRRSFDVALLTGQEDRACEAMITSPDLAPTFPARIFCLARSGDWNAAALTLRTAQSLGLIGETEDTLLSRFLDPDLYEGEPVPPAPTPVTPLFWKMYEAIGEPLPTTGLPLAFAHAELGPHSGWKAQIEAAERLTRAGTIAPNVILGLYTERQAAASGGVWDRVDAFAAFDAALQARDAARVAATLPVAWGRMGEAELEVPFATLYARDLMALDLAGPAAAVAFRVALLSPAYQTAAAEHVPADLTEAFLVAVAKGDLTGVPAPDTLGRAIAPAFLAPTLSAEARQLIEGNRTGEALLLAIESIGRGAQGDLRGVTEGLSLLREAGLEDVARRTALELMILERRG